MEHTHEIQDEEKRARIEMYIRMMQTAISGIQDEIEAERHFGSILQQIDSRVLELTFKYVPPQKK
jgi:hypothetical protein